MKIMKRCCVLFLSLSLVFCCFMDVAVASSKIAEREGAVLTAERLEKKQMRVTELPFPEQYELCTAYALVKDYKKIFQCGEDYFSHSEHGYVKSVGKFNFAALTKEKVVRITTLMRNDIQVNAVLAMTNLSLEQYDEALAHIVGAKDGIEEMFSWYRQLSKFTGEKIQLINNLYIQNLSGVLVTEAVLYKKRGEIDKAAGVLKELEGLYTTIDTSVQEYDCRYIVNYSIMLMAWSLEDYQKSYDILALNKTLPKQAAAQTLSMDMGADEFFAASLLNLKRYKEADAAFKQFFARYGDKILSEKAYSYYGRTKAALGEHEQAVELYKKGIDILEQQRSTLSSESSKIGFVGSFYNRYTDIVKSLLVLGREGEAFEYVERGKSRSLVDILAEIKSFGGGARQDNSARLLSGLKKDELGLNGSIETAVAQRKQQIRLAEPELASLVSVHSVTVRSIQQQLQTDETLLEYFGDDESLFVFIVTRDTVQAVILDGRQLAENVDTFKQKIQVYDSNAYLAMAQKLYDQILAPVRLYIKTDTLTIIPHGPLHYVPFNALHDGTSFLIETYAIRMLPSASVMTFLDTKVKPDGSMVIFANPDLGDRQYDLPAAELEGQAIATGNAQSRLLIGGAATETALRQYGAKKSYLHIASHGEFNADKPLTSSLLLAGDASHDGRLLVSELYTLELNNNLVVLSACETGLGDVKNGDDVIGLTRGFFFSGAQSIVSSLWMVDDTATANLMVSFYNGLKSQDKQDSLRSAQLRVKSEYNEHPFFWAAFQLSGAR